MLYASMALSNNQTYGTITLPPPKYVTNTTRTTAMIAFKTVTKSATVDGIQKTPSIKTPSIRTQTNLNYLIIT